jgi:hypothetical protein
MSNVAFERRLLGKEIFDFQSNFTKFRLSSDIDFLRPEIGIDIFPDNPLVEPTIST